MRGTNVIIVSAQPNGKFMEGTIVGTPKPGTLMEMTNAAPTLGRFSYQPVTRATGAKGPIIVLLADDLQGKLAAGASLGALKGGTPGDAYVSGTRGFLYMPEAGDELNLIVADVAGTADDVARGDKLGVETVTGKLKKDSSFASAPFTALEQITDPAADYLLWVRYDGNNA